MIIIGCPACFSSNDEYETTANENIVRSAVDIIMIRNSDWKQSSMVRAPKAHYVTMKWTSPVCEDAFTYKIRKQSGLISDGMTLALITARHCKVMTCLPTP